MSQEAGEAMPLHIFANIPLTCKHQNMNIMCVCGCVCGCVYVCVYVYVYVYDVYVYDVYVYDVYVYCMYMMYMLADLLPAHKSGVG